MKLYRKIRKLAHPLTYRRAWRRAQRSIFRLPLGPLRTTIDPERLREIQQRYANVPAGYAKYTNVDPWLRLNRERVQDLKLHRSAPKRVLDLGCGGGFSSARFAATSGVGRQDLLRAQSPLRG